MSHRTRRNGNDGTRDADATRTGADARAGADATTGAAGTGGRTGAGATATVAGRPPTRQELLVATGIAAGVALVVLVLFVLPAEYGIDPTRVGAAVGIDALGEVPVSGSEVPVLQERGPWRELEQEVVVPPGQGVEFKLHAQEGAVVLFSWQANGTLYYDFHGEPDDAAPGVFSSYDAATADAASGEFRAPFTGRHGWYWRNGGAEAVTVSLRSVGHFDVVGLV